MKCPQSSLQITRLPPETGITAAPMIAGDPFGGLGMAGTVRAHKIEPAL